MTLFDYCVTAQRLGSSRGLAWQQWKRYNPQTRTAAFNKAWAGARAAEELRASMQPGLGPARS